MPGQRRAQSWWLMTFGGLIALAGIVRGYLYPGIEKPVETVPGTIVGSQVVPAGARDYLRRQTVGVKLTVLYIVDGTEGRLSESVSARAGVVRELYAIGAPVTVYIGRDKDGHYATLNGPGAPRVVLWTTVALFGMGWVVLGWFIGRPTQASPAVKRAT